MFRKLWNTIRLAALVTVLLGGQVAAQTNSAPESSSNNYKVNEYMFGVGGDPDVQSDNYRANASAGALGVGDSASDNYSAQAGFLTPSEPFLEMVVTEDTVDFGELSDTSTSYGTAVGGGCGCSFNVRAYLSSSYVIYTVSQPPMNENGDTLDAKATLGAPSTDPNVEEFGINLADNTAATADIGAPPFNVPTNEFADGIIETGYNTPDQYKYGVGDIIARSPGTPGNPAIGQTNFTISYMAKRTALTPAGLYQMDHVLVVVATY